VAIIPQSAVNQLIATGLYKVSLTKLLTYSKCFLIPSNIKALGYPLYQEVNADSASIKSHKAANINWMNYQAPWHIEGFITGTANLLLSNLPPARENLPHAVRFNHPGGIPSGSK